MNRSLRFYRDLLHIDVGHCDEIDGHKLVRLQTGQTELVLSQKPLNEQHGGHDRRTLVINFHVRNLPEFALALGNLGVETLQSLDIAVSGEHTMLVADPDGYAVLLSEPVESGFARAHLA